MPYRETSIQSIDAFLDLTHQAHQNKQYRSTFEFENHAPFFQIFHAVHIPVSLLYTDAIGTLVQVLFLIYNKLTEITKTEN
jgi:hypothetical protein